jgi:TPR repeat protein
VIRAVTAQDYAKGFAAYQRGDFATAMWEWKPLAEQGDALAQHNLGVMYRAGYGVPRAPAE